MFWYDEEGVFADSIDAVVPASLCQQSNILEICTCFNVNYMLISTKIDHTEVVAATVKCDNTITANVGNSLSKRLQTRITPSLQLEVVYLFLQIFSSFSCRYSDKMLILFGAVGKAYMLRQYAPLRLFCVVSSNTIKNLRETTK